MKWEQVHPGDYRVCVAMKEQGPSQEVELRFFDELDTEC